eukprot:TRINITY_DN122110_c0_g1_i1.p1 TRINITY_DN122110_c0_g1~~TRINITY_DN122110_c0_g1_i1.p1  ORF type:complete len:371 (+),score=40.77 TRINITY_DN122110_c0_g1_i1:105-1217(+)
MEDLRGRRVDPADGQPYTWDDLSWFYMERYTRPDIKRYWSQCACAEPSESNLIHWIRENCANQQSPQHVLKKVSRQWGLKDFAELGFGTWSSWLALHNLEQDGAFKRQPCISETADDRAAVAPSSQKPRLSDRSQKPANATPGSVNGGRVPYLVDLPGDLCQAKVFGPTADARDAETFLHMARNIAGDKRIIWGMDLEWRPVFQAGQTSPTSILSLSSPESALVLLWDVLSAKKAGMWPPFPACLLQLLEDDSEIKAGMGLTQDAQRLAQEYRCGLVLRGLLNLKLFQRLQDKPIRGDLVGGGLSGAGSKLLGKPVPKSKKVTMSNWNQRPLSSEQIRYAACDAYLSGEVARILAVDDPVQQSLLSEVGS